MKLSLENWAKIQKRIEEVAGNNYGDVTIKFIGTNYFLIKGGKTERLEPVDNLENCIDLTIIKKSVIV